MSSSYVAYRETNSLVRLEHPLSTKLLENCKFCQRYFTQRYYVWGESCSQNFMNLTMSILIAWTKASEPLTPLPQLWAHLPVNKKIHPTISPHPPPPHPDISHPLPCIKINLINYDILKRMKTSECKTCFDQFRHSLFWYKPFHYKPLLNPLWK